MVPFEATELRFPGFLGRRSLRRRATAKALSTYLMVFQLVLSALSALSYNAVKKNALLSWLVVLVPSTLGCCIGVHLLTTRRSVLLGGFSDAAPRADSRAPRRLAADAADAKPALRSSDEIGSEIGAAGGEGSKAADASHIAMKVGDSTGAASVSAATPVAEATEGAVVATVEAPLLRLWQLRRDERGMVGQHGQRILSPPPLLRRWLAAPELGSCASSARARRLWLAQPSQGGGRATGARPTTASGARSPPPKSPIPPPLSVNPGGLPNHRQDGHRPAQCLCPRLPGARRLRGLGGGAALGRQQCHERQAGDQGGLLPGRRRRRALPALYDVPTAARQQY